MTGAPDPKPGEAPNSEDGKASKGKKPADTFTERTNAWRRAARAHRDVTDAGFRLLDLIYDVPSVRLKGFSYFASGGMARGLNKKTTAIREIAANVASAGFLRIIRHPGRENQWWPWHNGRPLAGTFPEELWQAQQRIPPRKSGGLPPRKSGGVKRPSPPRKSGGDPLGIPGTILLTELPDSSSSSSKLYDLAREEAAAAQGKEEAANETKKKWLGAKEPKKRNDGPPSGAPAGLDADSEAQAVFESLMAETAAQLHAQAAPAAPEAPNERRGDPLRGIERDPARELFAEVGARVPLSPGVLRAVRDKIVEFVAAGYSWADIVAAVRRVEAEQNGWPSRRWPWDRCKEILAASNTRRPNGEATP